MPRLLKELARLQQVRELRGRPAPEEPEPALPPVADFLGAEDARIDLEQSPSSFKRPFASFQRRIQSRTSSTEDMGT